MTFQHITAGPSLLAQATERTMREIVNPKRVWGMQVTYQETRNVLGDNFHPTAMSRAAERRLAVLKRLEELQ